MSRFPTPGHLASWAGTCPGSNESAGRIKSTHTRPGNPYLKGALGVAALSAARSHDTYLAAKYRRIASRRGPVKAIVALEHAMLIAIWNMINTGTIYRDPGGDFYARLNPDKAKAPCPRPTPQDGLFGDAHPPGRGWVKANLRLRGHNYTALVALCALGSLTALLSATDEGLVELDRAGEAVGARLGHDAADLVGEVPRGLVVESHRALDAHRGDAGLRVGHVPGDAQPDVERHVGALHHRPGRQRERPPAFLAPPLLR